LEVRSIAYSVSGAMAQGQMQQFASQPMPVAARSGKYRDPDETMKSNMMHDRRVVRGNTHASMVQTQPDAAEVRKQREAQRRRLQRANQTKKRAGTPEPVVGRKHMDIQTDSYLEELTERTVEFEAETQTDINLDRPVSPLFMPAKIGVDTETQIEEGELFDFDAECEPVLEVLVGKTLEQGMMEVLEEEELESLQRHQEDFERKRNAELSEVQRMEAAEKRRDDEMKRRKAQQESQRLQDLAIMRKVVSRSIAYEHLSSLKDRTLGHLLDAGCFVDSVQLAVDNAFMPTLLASVTKHVDEAQKDRALVADVMQATVASRLATHDQALEVERRRRAAIDQAAREARAEAAQLKEASAKAQLEVQAAQEALLEWEAYVPPAAVKSEDRFVLTEIRDGQVCYSEGLVAKVPEEQLEELTAKLEEASAKRTEAAAAGEDVEANGPVLLGKISSAGQDQGAILESFWVGSPAELAASPEAATGGDEGQQGDEPQQ